MTISLLRSLWGRRLLHTIFALYVISAVTWLLFGVVPALDLYIPAVAELLRRIIRLNQGAPWVDSIVSIRMAAFYSSPPMSIVFQYTFSLLNLGLGMALVRTRPTQWLPWLLAIALVGTAAVYNLQAHVLIEHAWGENSSPVWLLHEFLHMAAGSSYLLALLLFPTGTLPPWPWQGWRPPVRLHRLMVLGLIPGAAIFGWLYIYLSHWEPAGYVAFFGVMVPLVGLTSGWLRWRRTVDPEERAILRMWLFALVLALGATVVIGLISYALTVPSLRFGSATQRTLDRLAFTLFPILFTGIPVSLTFIVLRYRLWALNRIINRSLLYGALTTLIGGLYVLIVGSVNALLQDRWHWIPVAVAVGLAAILFQPLRAWLQAEVDRLMYGDRETESLRLSRELLVNAREEERRRLRRELHDDLGPQLASLSLKVDAARNAMQSDPQTSAVILGEVRAQLQTAVEGVRRTVHDLRPPALDQLGLVSALREQAATLSSQSGMQITVVGPEDLPPLPAAVEVAAYRIALEALTNCLRHAQASHCYMGVCLSDQLHLVIEDNGIGLSADRPVGVGLVSMQERAEELGGAFRIQSRPGRGVRIDVILDVTR